MAGTRKARVLMAEQIRLINECRQSGMTDGPGSSRRFGIFPGGSLTG